jgi:uncharacterized protein YjbI with pentapeptide repeats
MDRDEALALLGDGAVGIARWNTHRESAEGLPDLSGADLRSANLRRADLSGANLSGANFRSAKLHSAKLHSADLRSAKLRNADLSCTDLRNAYLSGADLGGADFSGADLSRAYLHNADLSGVDLSDADLSDANLRSTKLHSADLRSANLSRANLSRADLSDANLTGAELHDADLTGANLRRANLSGAKLSRLRLFATSIIGLDLSAVGAEELEAVLHGGPSSLGTDTLVLSRGRIPATFLKGCGLSEWEIESAKLYDPALAPEQINESLYRIFALRAARPFQVSPVFVSYSWNDTPLVDALCSEFENHHIRYWRDRKDATAGRLDRQIDRAISLNPTVIVVLSQASVASPWVEFEVDKAVELTRKLGRDVLCPIALDDTWLGDRMSGQLRAQIKKYNVLPFCGWQDADAFKQQVRKLLEGLELFYKK